MKRNQGCILFCLLVGAIVFQCSNSIGACHHDKIPGYIAFNKIDSSLSKGLRENYYYYWSRFIYSDYSDTIHDCYVIINAACSNEGTIKLDSLYPCIWDRLSGGCGEYYIEISSIPKTCYDGSSFKTYE
jgi:hypothetical protein